MSQTYLRISDLMRLERISRTTLLYYEKQGLIVPERSPAGYRLYSPEARHRLAALRRYRRLNLPLATIRQLLDTAETGAAQVLAERLVNIDRDIEALRRQREQLAVLLTRPDLLLALPVRDRSEWTALLRKAGFDEAGMQAWHRGFEQSDPAAHDSFLIFLGIEAPERARIRRW